jgi:hypothetical protein
MNTIKRNLFLNCVALLALYAVIGLLVALALPALAQDQQGLARRTCLLTTQGFTNAVTKTLNINTNLIVGSTYYSDYLTLWSTSQCTNTPVTGNTTITWKFAWDLPSGTNATGTNFQGGGTMVFVNNGQTVVNNYTNIPSIYWRGANAVQLTSIQTAGNTNGVNGDVIGQTTSVWLVQLK